MLLEPVRIRSLQLGNRTVMAPMTRSRAVEGNTPNALMAEYYAQRASAGLIVTEGTSPSPNGLGYPRIPGLYHGEHVRGWRLITEAVHARGGKIVVQLMHTGRITHLGNLPPGAEVLAPMDGVCPGEIYNDALGLQPHSPARAMNEGDIAQAVDEFAQSAHLAIEAGFDGVEIHAANGYLHHQFLSSNSNQRTDEYGGSVENRIRFTTETVAAVSAAIGADRTGIRISPGHMFNDIADANPTETHAALLDAIDTGALAYVHLMLPDSFAPQLNNAGDVGTLVSAIRAHTKGNLIAAGGYTKEKAEAALSSGQLQAVVFGRPFIANPDLVARLKNNWPLAEANPDLFYTPGAQGYSDYPAYKP